MAPDRLDRRAGLEGRASVDDNKPEDLFAFLAEPEFMPDLEDPETRKIGYMKEGKARRTGGGRPTSWKMLQNLVGLIIYSWPVQTFVFMVVMFDMVLTGMSFGEALQEDGEETHPLYSIGDIAIVSILASDVCLRWLAEGRFFVIPPKNCKMNIFEATLVPITIAEITVLQDMALPLPLLRALRPILRGVRILRVLIRTAGKGQVYLVRLRHQVSGDRLRFTQEGFDLDLQYITPQILVMSDPAVGSEAILRNPMREVARFLNEKHANKYVVLNTTEVRRYPLQPFFSRYFDFPIAQDSVPSLESLMRLVSSIDVWLRQDDAHVLAAHSKHNQGRVALVVIALMLYRKEHRSAISALGVFEHHRKRKDAEMEGNQTLDSASQMRFLEYFAHMCSHRNGLPQRSARITRIQLSGLSNAHLLDLSCFSHTGAGGRLRNSSRAKTFSGVSGDNDDDDDEGLTTMVAEEPASLQRRVLNAIEEGVLDSRRSGTAPMTTQPVFSSKSDLIDERKIHVKTMKNTESGISIARLWTIEDIELSGELRLEIHMEGESAVRDMNVPASSRCWCCCRRRAKASSSGGGGSVPRKFQGGMLFGCWLHTSLLEHDEIKDKRPVKGKGGHRIEIAFDRFSVDKAANAPSLRSLSTAMKLEIDFHVDHRVQLLDLDADAPGVNLVTSNVNMSEWESLKWLTWVSERVWPNFRKGFEKMINDSVEGARQSLRGPLKNLKVRQCSFGEAFPKFKGIAASSRNYLDSNDRHAVEVQLDIGLDYSSETNIVLEVGLLAFGINHIKIGGMLSLKFTPLLDEIPVFAAFQLFFLNSPDVDIRFANVLEVANVSFIMETVRNKILQAINNRLVVPNVLNINWADPSNDDSVTWTSIMPSFVIRVKVNRARGLTSSSSMLVRAPEAFARLSVGQQQVRTTPIKGQNPTWNESFDFVIYDERQCLSLKIYDSDFTGRHWSIGAIEMLPVSLLAEEGKGTGVWKQLQGTPNRSASEVFVMASVYDLLADPAKLHEVLDKESVVEDDVVQTARDGNSSPVIVEVADTPPVEDDEGTSKVEDDEIMQDDPEEAEMEEELEVAEQQRAGSVALLVCTIMGGQLPGSLGKPTDVELKVQFGSASVVEDCQDPSEGSTGNLSEKVQKSIERLQGKNLSAAEIAEVLDEDVADVTRVMRRAVCNLSVQQKLCLHIDKSDLRDARDIRFIILGSKKKVLAEGTESMHKLMSTHTGRHDGEVVCSSSRRGGPEVKLDVDFRLFTLVLRDSDIEPVRGVNDGRKEEDIKSMQTMSDKGIRLQSAQSFKLSSKERRGTRDQIQS